MASLQVDRQSAQAASSPAQSTALNRPVNTHYYLTEGLEGVEHRPYRGAGSFTRAIKAHVKLAMQGDAGHYIVYRPLTKDQFTTIDRIRDTRHQGLRFMYLEGEQALIVKVKLDGQETAQRLFEGLVMAGAYRNGIPGTSFFSNASATMIAPSGLKEPDCSYRPRSRPHRDWPTLVIEAVLSDAATRLVAESRWWLENSGGKVKIVITITVWVPERRMHIEKWENVTAPTRRVTRAHPYGSMPTPTKTHEIDIVGDVVTGAPLTLEFEKLMLRQPDAGEGDLTIDVPDLQHLATTLWRSQSLGRV